MEAKWRLRCNSDHGVLHDLVILSVKSQICIFKSGRFSGFYFANAPVFQELYISTTLILYTARKKKLLWIWFFIIFNWQIFIDKETNNSDTNFEITPASHAARTMLNRNNNIGLTPYSWKTATVKPILLREMLWCQPGIGLCRPQ